LGFTVLRLGFYGARANVDAQFFARLLVLVRRLRAES
jgi:hypothetical protein